MNGSILDLHWAAFMIVWHPSPCPKVYIVGMKEESDLIGSSSALNMVSFAGTERGSGLERKIYRRQSHTLQRNPEGPFK